jgi:hypothetical protein
VKKMPKIPVVDVNEMCEYSILERIKMLQDARPMFVEMGDKDEVLDIDSEIAKLKKALDK